ncbi:conserved hypothetical protein [Histoplasma capsulatum G186AR]|uniref:Low temperature essential 1 n=2 Tax=Ajellomyces capsulatus TaxID=5037 RepID=C0NL79_AJECG|nr:mitotic regulator LTE1 [Histoplasma capsulatum G186AR]EEH08620.1 conserved hypothetical protein [Histoplasma capsulatum G186AR]KAG5299060.1 low temperature essential 1 [Histoplasma capsulatum]QSS68320.1 low temperature essential 1 [Histoplasma capsulatum G186AR]
MESEFRHVERTPLTPIQSEGKTSGIFTKQAVNEPRSKRVPNHASRSENHSFGQPHTRLQDGQARNNTSPAKAKQRTNSLRRAKNSSEVLRQRALKRSNTIDVPPEGIGISGLGGREARHFTVGNVGHNGKMYLRPTNQTRLQPLPVIKAPPPSLNKQYLHPETHQQDNTRLARHSMWSNSQLSELRPQMVREDSNESKHDVSTTTDDQESRRHSLDNIPSSDPRNRRELRIVIERPESERPKSADQPPVPAIEVPIPHFRLGGFRFTSEGNPTLRSSACTRTSASEHFRSSMGTENDSAIAPRPSRLVHQDSRTPGTNSILRSVRTGNQEFNELPNLTSAQSSVFYKLREPIEPSIFDFLLHKMDDPSVVRYVKGSNEISAATPARIVAQISSDSFMDYELVSDFFLTFRSYLSPGNLLSLLLARLQWAISRLEDDGRIIRIRTFAALRHWILNYFVDDFVINRDLRVQFCQRLNQIYENVRSSSNNSASDLKILLDLKRCWNGRCALYWDSPDFVNDAQPDDKVMPGGVAGSRDVHLSRLSGIRASSHTIESQAVDVVPQLTASPLKTTHQKERDVHRSPSHTHNFSAMSARDLPPSSDSVKSIQAASCSLPSKGQKRGSTQSTRPKGPHPILVTSSPRSSPTSTDPPATAPMIQLWRRPTHSHKRSGSFSDSVRDDRAPLPALNLDTQRQSLLQALPHAESIIRGNAYGPVDPSVPIIAPASPTLEATQFFVQPTPVTKGDNLIKSTPGVKTFIGTIRRALHNRQSGHSSTPQPSNSSPLPSLKGKTSALPLNVGVGCDTYRERRSGPDARVNLRIDVLCDNALQCYRQLVLRESLKSEPVSEIVPTRELEKDRLFLPESTDKLNPGTDFKYGLGLERIPSQLTAGSKSIVIVDDTRPAIPLISGALQTIQNVHRQFQESPLHDFEEAIDASSPISHRDTLVGAPGPSLERYDTNSISETRDSRTSEDYVRFPEKRSSSVVRNGSKTPVRSSSGSRLRRYASYHSGMVKFGKQSSIGFANETVSRSGSFRESREKPFARMLRRRPGGDLRKIQNVHDLQAGPRVRSFASGTSYTASMAESLLYLNKDGTAGAPPNEWCEREEALLPMQHHSATGARHSHRMRASFEAAVAGFSRIPDDEDGGIESTLLKLEGKWEKPSPATPRDCKEQPNSGDTLTDKHNDRKEQFYRQRYLTEPAVAPTFKSDNDRKLSTITAPDTESFIGSEDSYCSIPLLERGLSDESMKSPIFSPPTQSPLQTFNQDDDPATGRLESSHPSIDMVEETESLKRIPQGSTVPRPPTLSSSLPKPNAHEGDDDDGYGSELSSEISVIDKDEAVDKYRKTSAIASIDEALPSLDMLSHPLRHPPSPPMTARYPGSTSSYAAPVDTITLQRQPITPDLSPSGKNLPSTSTNRTLDLKNLSSNILFSSETQTYVKETPAMLSSNNCHLPFILACESLVLAQQFTLVEKAALNEVDWKDLVDMRWSQSSQSTLNWASYLSQHDRRGIDIVVARFNLMVKWAVSEVVLTKNITERARTITKLIHVAVHSRRLRNYSTMLQITIALCSVDCTRLTKTWELVADGEKRLLKDMETLAQPIRNFQKLRLEMETTNLQDGCVPFVGLYVQDLTYNSQKPAQIASTRDGEPLVNFERYRTAATIVKSLLRLIDASTKYTFEPVYGIIERCLWISALPDEKIVALSNDLAQ